MCILLVRGYLQIRRGARQAHQKSMLAALVCSVLFLCSYLIYHVQVGSVPYPHYDWTRPLYFAVLIPHIILAAIMAPFVALVLARLQPGFCPPSSVGPLGLADVDICLG